MPTEQDPPVTAKQAARELLENNSAGERVGSRDIRHLKSALTDQARQGDVDAQNLLGAIELEIEQKPKSARQWFEMSAAKGDPAGQRSLGHLYANGLGVKADVAKAVELFRAASAGGDAFAMYNLAAANIRAKGAYCTFDETLSLLESAAEGGVVESAAKLGDLLAGVGRNAEAIDWYVKAASRGHTGAMDVAACWFRDGTAGPPDPVQAVRWFLAMLNSGNGDGVHEAIQVAKSMNPEQIREAARLAGRVGDGEAIIATISR
jgi:hypothetical protein